MLKNEIRLNNMLSTCKSESISKLNPHFITGLTDAEGSFSITKHKNNRAKYKINIGLSFRISMLNNEIELFSKVKDFFGCGNILFDDKRGTLIPAITFGIHDITSINNTVIPHFTKYPLRGTKYLDYLTFKKAVDFINSKKHLTKEGIDEIIEMSYSMNTFRKFTKEYCPIHTIESSPEYISISGHYINGFIAGDGCLTLNTKDVGFGTMSIKISQHKNNRLLLVSILSYFKSSSKIYTNTSSMQITLSGHKLWQTIIFDHFSKYPLHGTKLIRLKKLFIIRELMLNNNHLIQIGSSRQWKPNIKLSIINIWNSNIID